MKKDPYYSIILTGRNDNYGKHFLFRVRSFFDSLMFQIEKYKLSCEIIIVEWNPPGDSKRLSTILKEWFPTNFNDN